MRDLPPEPDDFSDLDFDLSLMELEYPQLEPWEQVRDLDELEYRDRVEREEWAATDEE